MIDRKAKSDWRWACATNDNRPTVPDQRSGGQILRGTGEPSVNGVQDALATLYSERAMSQIEIAQQIVAAYERHGWKLRRVLLQPAARAEFKSCAEVFGEVSFIDAEVDALWFARPSHAGREAWELRLISEQAYALFEAFDVDDEEEDREAARREMENMMRDYANPVASRDP